MILRLMGIVLGLISIGCQATESKNHQKELERQATTPPNPQIALEFTNDYIVYLNENYSELRVVEWVKSQNTITSDFKYELERIITEAEKEDPELGLGFDPILAAQDYPDKGFKLHKHDPDPEFLIVEGVEWETFKLTMKIKEVDGQWLVDGSGVINIPEEKRME